MIYYEITLLDAALLFVGGCPGFDWYDSGYKLQVERPSPDWAKLLTANNDSYEYALAA